MSGGDDVGMTKPFTGTTAGSTSKACAGGVGVSPGLDCKPRGGGGLGEGTRSGVPLKTGAARLGVCPTCGLGSPPKGRCGVHNFFDGLGSPFCGH